MTYTPPIPTLLLPADQGHPFRECSQRTRCLGCHGRRGHTRTGGFGRAGAKAKK